MTKKRYIPAHANTAEIDEELAAQSAAIAEAAQEEHRLEQAGEYTDEDLEERDPLDLNSHHRDDSNRWTERVNNHSVRGAINRF